MDTSTFMNAYHESRNGANHFVRHWANRNFQFSDGVEQCAEAGCMWLIDIIATECANKLRASGEVMGIIYIDVADSKALIEMSIQDDAPMAFSRHIDFTDMPDGKWTFYLVDEMARFALILPSEY